MMRTRSWTHVMMKALLLLMALHLLLPVPAAQADSDDALGYHYTYARHVEPTLLGYTPGRIITGEDLGVSAFNMPSDLFVTEAGLCYLADTGNNRILVFDVNSLRLVTVIDSFINDGQPDGFNGPQGVFISSFDGAVYIADTQNRRVVHLDREGKLVKLVQDPQADVIKPGYIFKPRKLTADEGGRLYVVAEATTEGLVQFASTGEFISFFGSNPVRPNAYELLLRMFLTREQRAKRSIFIPIEYSNIAIDNRNFIYTTTVNTWDNQLSRLNYLGSNIMRHEGRNQARFGDIGGQLPYLLDVTVDHRGNVTALDGQNGRLFQYSPLGELLFIYGGINDSAAGFRSPVAVEEYEGSYLVLDQVKRSITLFEPTDFATAVLAASNDYFEGRYAQAKAGWEAVNLRNNNYSLAHVGMGDAFYEENRFEDAMASYQQGFNHKGYSKAFKGYRTAWFREHFSLLMTLGLAAIVLLVATAKPRKQLALALSRAYRRKPGRFKSVLDTTRYGLHVIVHPFDGFWDLKHEKKHGFGASVIIILLTVFTMIMKTQAAGYLFRLLNILDRNILLDALSVLVPLIMWVMVNWSITTLFDGKATARQIFISTSFALLPIVLIMLPMTLLSHLFIQEEAVFFVVAEMAAFAWCIWLILVGSMSVQDYTMTKTVIVAFFTLVGIVASMFLLSVFYSAITQVIGFFTTLVMEVRYW